MVVPVEGSHSVCLVLKSGADIIHVLLNSVRVAHSTPPRALFCSPTTMSAIMEGVSDVLFRVSVAFLTLYRFHPRRKALLPSPRTSTSPTTGSHGGRLVCKRLRSEERPWTANSSLTSFYNPGESANLTPCTRLRMLQVSNACSKPLKNPNTTRSRSTLWSIFCSNGTKTAERATSRSCIASHLSSLRLRTRIGI